MTHFILRPVILVCLLPVLVLPVCGYTATGTATGTLTVKATIQEACYVNTSSSGTTTNSVIDFGTLNSLAADNDASTSTSGGAQAGVLCSKSTVWSLAADGGQHAVSGQRHMSGGRGSDTLKYDLYSDSNRTSAVTANGVVASGTGTGLTQAVDIYGRIPGGTELPPAGSYTDSVLLTVTF